MLRNLSRICGAALPTIVSAGMLASSGLAAGADEKPVKPPAAPKVQPQKVPVAKAPGVKAPGVVRPPATNAPATSAPAPGARGGAVSPDNHPDNHPGEQVLDRLLKATPEQREQALRGLPEQRRINLQRRIEQIQKLPSAALNLNLARLERLNRLPQPRQGQVRRSINQFGSLPDERRAQMSRELQKLASLPDEDRRAYMNTEEFRNRYSPNEQQIIANISEVTPDI